jgi:hypothetical protein
MLFISNTFCILARDNGEMVQNARYLDASVQTGSLQRFQLYRQFRWNQGTRPLPNDVVRTYAPNILEYLLPVGSDSAVIRAPDVKSIEFTITS